MTALTEIVNAKGQPLTLERLEWAVRRVTAGALAGRPLAAIRASTKTREDILLLSQLGAAAPDPFAPVKLAGLPVEIAPERTGLFLEFCDARNTVILRIENLSGGQ